MKWRSVFSVIPVPVLYTDALPEGVGGQVRNVFPVFFTTIRIRPRYEHDEGIHRHELAHVELRWLTLGLSVFITAKRFRIWNEARAYKVQMRYPDSNGHYMSLDAAAQRLAGPHYGFGLTQEQARTLIQEA